MRPFHGRGMDTGSATLRSYFWLLEPFFFSKVPWTRLHRLSFVLSQAHQNVRAVHCHLVLIYITSCLKSFRLIDLCACCSKLQTRDNTPLVRLVLAKIRSKLALHFPLKVRECGAWIQMRLKPTVDVWVVFIFVFLKICQFYVGGMCTDCVHLMDAAWTHPWCALVPVFWDKRLQTLH